MNLGVVRILKNAFRILGDARAAPAISGKARSGLDPRPDSDTINGRTPLRCGFIEPTW